jgi:GNAT superfamily N-acetyltransferase
MTPAPLAGESLALPDGAAVRLRHAGLESPRGEGESIIASDARGDVVGRVSYARVYGPRALVRIEVDDAYWHLGLPGALLARLCAAAAHAGISTFLVRVPASDMRLLALLRGTFAARESRDGAMVDAELQTTAPGRSGPVSS